MSDPTPEGSGNHLIARILRLLGQRDRIIIGIAGSPGAGKSTVAAWLVDELSSIAAASSMPMDGYHLADQELARMGKLGSKGAIDTFDAYGYLATIRRIRAEVQNIVYAPQFDRLIEQPISGGIAIPPETRVVITEGNYLLDSAFPWSQLREELDETWFYHIDDELRRQRLVERHIRYGKTPDEAMSWVRDVDEPNARRIAATSSRADLVITSDDITP